MNKCAAIFFLLATPALAAGNPTEIMQKNETVRQLSDLTSSATLTTGGGDSQTRVKSFTWWRKLTGDKVHFNTFTRFHAPAEIKGEGILFNEHEGDDSDVFLYLPAFKKIRRVERGNQSGSFMGSEFSYADIATPHVEDFNHALVRDEACPLTPSVKCHVIESTPKRDATKERTGYIKTTQWIRQDNFMGEKVEHICADGSALCKRIEATKITEVDTVGHKWMALSVKVVNLKNQKFTSMDFADVKANTGVSDAIFTQQNLSKP